ncbi:MAG: hypothetical protein RI946_737 [Pseudomonadota bacterium]
MLDIIATLSFSSPDDTAGFAVRMGSILRPSDMILLHGGIGAGKSFFARALIQSVQDVPEDVPSPTFTLVQTYDTQLGEIWHADLYRLSGSDEVIELGLLDAFETAISLIEWPDRLADLSPQTALHLKFTAQNDDTRTLTIAGNADLWKTRMTAVLHDPS